jgi:hypothetical protein
MAKYRITAPDGGTYEITAPDDATEDQVMAYAQKNYQGPAKVGAGDTAPEKEPPPSWRVAMNAANKGIAALPDALLNTPSNLFNLGKSAFGAGATALGRPDLAPEITQPPNFAHRAMEGMGFVRPQDEPQTGGQRLLDAAVQGGVATALGSPASGVRQAAINTGMGALSGGAANIVGEATGSPELAIAASIAAPAVASRIPSVVANNSRSMARALMQSALKPSIKQMKTGQGDRAITTMLDEGINATRSGVDKAKSRVDDLNTQISNAIADSTATVDRGRVLATTGETRAKFLNQADPGADLAAIDGITSRFASHPYFESIEAKGQPLIADLARAREGKIQALQAAGKLKTFAAQQGNLAEGAALPLMKSQPENQPYFNTGGQSGQAMSPSAYPVQGMPRVPPRYTHNIDRVPEGNSGYADAMAAYLARRGDESAALQKVNAWEQSRGQLPVQQAQAMKQGTYKVLHGKYGEQGSAATETQKALARGLKDEVAAAVPEIAPLNAREGGLLDVIAVAERRAMTEGNKNPAGLSLLTPTPAGFAAFMADRSGALKSVGARGLHQVGKIPQMPMDKEAYIAMLLNQAQRQEGQQ